MKSNNSNCSILLLTAPPRVKPNYPIPPTPRPVDNVTRVLELVTVAHFIAATPTPLGPPVEQQAVPRLTINHFKSNIFNYLPGAKIVKKTGDIDKHMQVSSIK